MFRGFMNPTTPFYFHNSTKFLNKPMDQQLLACGSCGEGQFGSLRGENGDSCAKFPTKWAIKPNNGEADPIVQVCCGERHTTALTLSGKVYSCGADDQSQIGRKSREIIDLVEFRNDVRIVQISAGQNHNLAVSEDGRLYSWGSNDNLQCGFPSDLVVVRKPERVTNISGVCQIACGAMSSILLLESNKVIVFGWYIDQAIEPTTIELLSPIPIRQISAGADHFAVVSAGGSLLTFGRNDYNQTGASKQSEVRNPIVVFGLTQVVQVACGSKHTVVLTRNGRVYAFGANNFGQLGTGKRSAPLPEPQLVKELTGTDVKAIACGTSHTLALSPNRLYSFGLNNSGQLGMGSFNNQFSPTSVAVVSAKALFAGWDQSVVVVGERDWTPNSRMPRSLTYQEFHLLAENKDTIEVVEYLMFIFNSLGCLNGSFPQHLKNQDCYLLSHGLALDDVMRVFNAISESPHSDRFADTIISSLEQTRFEQIYLDLLANKRGSFATDELRIFLILPWFHRMVSPSDEIVRTILGPFVNILDKTVQSMGHVLRMWWSIVEIRHFNRIVQLLMNYVEFLFNKNHNNHEAFVPALNVLGELCQVNKATNKIPYCKFYLNSLQSKVNIRQDYVNDVVRRNPEKFVLAHGQRVPEAFWSRYSFLLNAEAKASILEADSSLRMQLAVSASQAPWAQLLNVFNPDDAFLTYVVRRDHIVDDTYEQVMQTSNHNAVKPLRIMFHGEEAEDRGGVRKEFFMILFERLLQPTYGMFTEDPESNLIWFTGVVDDLTSYEVVGFLCALAIYNFVIVNLPFPLALYKKILDQPITLEDFTELYPSEGKSLERLLEYEGDDLEDVFCLDFTVNISAFGHSQQVDLIENGSNTPVTQKNKADFVQRYIEMKMEKGLLIKDQLAAFIRGFKRVLNREVLNLFNPRELQEMIIGNEDYDWAVLKENTEYKGEYYARHPVIETFWAVFFELTPEQKRKFLLFLMGTDRVPLKGMKEIKMFIQPEPAELLPVAHTCFNLLDLPKITDKEEMKKRLLISLENHSGFSLA